ncbi:hypothetical protein SETIT_9G044800v2 [Setaria italica]|uniref:SGNH hydrolase-type esterase domain-containing protein n=1 Tax=Setaria italica TaxID=4555 RepID=A0A368SD11_SETIT|nr:hypothetical protein SETIT_9G044800v2 [Setaria italica]
MKLFAAACFVLLLLNCRVAESRRHRHHHSPKAAYRTHKLFVFGDDFADDGNGDSDSVAWHQPKPTGRFSDGLVQSDFLAKIMGHSESPPPYTGDDWDNGIDASGLNFAVAGAAALDVTGGVLNISAQVQQLRNLVRDGLVDDRDFKESVALVAYSGNDYTSQDNLDDQVAKVVDELASVVSQLQDLGVTKVLVNTVPPFGCSPWLARLSDYSSCDGDGNANSDKHNAALRDRLGGDIVTDLVAPKEGSALYAGKFTELLRPCCEGTGDGGYCGLDGGYSLCDHPEEYFYWDLVHPTHAGWRAVMQLLQGPIMAFLGISNLEHL